MSHDAPTVSERFIYGPTTTHDGSATIHHAGATNAHDASTIRYGASTIQAGSATVASRPPTNLHDLVVSDKPIRYERPRMTTNTTTIQLGMIPIPLR